jgi:protein phosphatase 1 regulatory subunit 11
MAFVAQAGGGPSNSVSRDGSRTALVVQNAEQRDASAAAPDLAVGLTPAGTLRLRGAPRNGPHVAWDEHVVDNEGLGRKKSKSRWHRSMGGGYNVMLCSVCCIYHRPRRFDESSDEGSSDSESDSDDDGTAKPSGRCHRHRHRADGEDEGDRYGEPEDKRHGKDDRNAYERLSPRKGKGRSS